MVVDFALVSSRDSMRVRFSRMLPVLVASSSRSFFSSCSSCTLSSSSCCRSWLLWLSSSGCSCWIVRPRSWPSSPPRVTEKLTRVTSADVSGVIVGAWLRVVSMRRKLSLKSICLSPTCTTQRGPWRTRSRRRRGTRTPSTESTSCTTSVLPKRTASSRAVEKRASLGVTVSTDLPPASRCLTSHEDAWLDGSMTKGTLTAYSITSALSMLSVSPGRP
mmetsp:Transcript_21789/g.58702  ORF Transcript_21789/g.58702 Transcript_21789/m.58702 type:complete len:218 (-) Transcript_21789:2070-2723(-)